MKSVVQSRGRRVELGRASLVTRGNVFGTIEQVGLYQARSSACDL